MKYLVPIVDWCLINILCANRGNAAGIGDHDLQTLGTIDIDNNLGLIQWKEYDNTENSVHTSTKEPTL